MIVASPWTIRSFLEERLGPRQAALFYFTSIIATALATGMFMALLLLEFLTGAVLAQMGGACLGIFAAGHGFLTASRLNYLLAAAALTVAFLQLAFLIGGGQRLFRVSRGSRYLRGKHLLACPALESKGGGFSAKRLHLLEGSEDIVTAMTVGLLKPAVYLSEGLVGHLSPAQLKAVIAHEDSHRLWRDNLLIAIAKILKITLFYVPGPRLAFSRMRKCMERAADRRAAAVSGGSFNVAEALAKVLAATSGEPEVQLASSASGGDLSGRIEELLKDKGTVRDRRRGLLVAAMVTATLAGSLVTFASIAYAEGSIDSGDAIVCFTRHHIPEDEATCEQEHGASAAAETPAT